MEAIGQFRAANMLLQANIVRYLAHKRRFGLQNSACSLCKRQNFLPMTLVKLRFSQVQP